MYYFIEMGTFFVNFNLQESETPTLQGLSFTVRPGELLAVVGPVGAGKVSCNAFVSLMQQHSTASVQSSEWNPEQSVSQFEFELSVSRKVFL